MALAIFGIAAGGVLAALGNHLKNVSFMQDHSRALRIASRELNAARRAALPQEGEIEGAQDRFFWTVRTTTEGLGEWPGLEGAAGTPMILSVVVQWGDRADGPLTGRVRLDGLEVF